MKILDNITVAIVDTKNYGEAIIAVRKTLEHIKPHRVIFLTDADLSVDCAEIVKIPSIKSKKEYSYFLIKELYKYIYTEYVLIIQHDGYVINGESWDEDFLNYDYIGALWCYMDGRDNGNGGFSLRSRHLLQALGTDPYISITNPEDEIIGRLYRKYLENEYDIKFATDEICNKFSFELREPTQKTFGFHGRFHNPFKEHIILKRTGAMGDVVMLEPVITYFNEQGYQVVLDTMPQFMQLFIHHPYRIKHISEVSEEILEKSRHINLDMGYEVSPKRPVLESYFELAGIKGQPLRNSKLNVVTQGKLFDKYCLIHIDDTGMPYRNAYMNEKGWKHIVDWLIADGYQVFQIGKRNNKKIAPYINTVDIPFMMHLLRHADLFIGIDSGPAQIAVSLNVPSLLFFGSVNPKFRYYDFSIIKIMQEKCETPNCYHSQIGVTGVDCIYNKTIPPCTQYNPIAITLALESLIKLTNKNY